MGSVKTLLQCSLASLCASASGQVPSAGRMPACGVSHVPLELMIGRVTGSRGNALQGSPLRAQEADYLIYGASRFFPYLASPEQLIQQGRWSDRRCDEIVGVTAKKQLRLPERKIHHFYRSATARRYCCPGTSPRKYSETVPLWTRIRPHEFLPPKSVQLSS